MCTVFITFILLYVICLLFPLWLIWRFTLSSVSISLKLICIGVLCVVFIISGVLWASWICDLKFWKIFWPLSAGISSTQISLSSTVEFHYLYIRLWYFLIVLGRPFFLFCFFTFSPFGSVKYILPLFLWISFPESPLDFFVYFPFLY